MRGGRKARAGLAGAVLALALLAALPVGSASGGLSGVFVLYESDGVRIPNDHSSARLSFEVPSEDIGSVAAAFRIRHERTQQLKLFVKAPGVPAVLLSKGDTKGENLGVAPCPESTTSDDNFTNISDSASNPLSSGTAPYVGDFLPRKSMSALEGTRPQGTWSLIVKDTAGGPSGKLMCGMIQIALAH